MPTLTKAHFKTLRESVGLTPKYLAAKVGCHDNMIWRMESPTHKMQPTEAAVSALRSLVSDFDMAATRLADESRRVGHIARPTTSEGFERLVPELADWPSGARGLFFAEVERQGVGYRIEYTEE